MPKEFDDCVKSGGKVRTKNLKGNKFIRICYDKKGKAHAGEVMTRKKKSKAQRFEKKVQDSKRLAASLLRLKDHYDTNYHS